MRVRLIAGIVATAAVMAGAMGTGVPGLLRGSSSGKSSGCQFPCNPREAQMKSTREAAWKVLEPFTRRTEGPPDTTEWTWTGDIFAKPANQDEHTLKSELRSSAAEAAQTTEPTLYETTFFNTTARTFIETQNLAKFETTDELQAKLVQQLSFPAGSSALKTFWYVLRPTAAGQPPARVDVKYWDWHATDNGATTLAPGSLAKQCVTLTPVVGCFVAKDWFYTTKVVDPKLFSCPGQCPSVNAGDTAILVAMHVASKQAEAPDWLWATFWWRGDHAGSGPWWTCGDAQRDVLTGPLPRQWKNYSMDVTKSFKQRKPLVDASNGCGVPGTLGTKHDAERASYNPFVEANFDNGFKSSCISCHARASTMSGTKFTIPAPDQDDDATLRELEGHIGLDYMWTVRNAGLRRTTWKEH